MLLRRKMIRPANAAGQRAIRYFAVVSLHPLFGTDFTRGDGWISVMILPFHKSKVT